MASTLTNLLYHVVFSTKHREPLIVPRLSSDLYAYMGGIIRSEGGALLEIGGMPDHVHLAVRLRSEPSLAQMIKVVKAKSSKWANERPERQGRFGWQTGYAALTVSPSQLPAVVTYIQNQPRHHKVRSFQDEFVALLKKHGIEYDARYVWD